jgi:hypothetical protein
LKAFIPWSFQNENPSLDPQWSKAMSLHLHPLFSIPTNYNEFIIKVENQKKL